MTSGRRLTLARAEGTVALRQWGKGEPGLLFAHATGLCASVYEGLLAPLAAAGFCVLAPDARGHGRTRLPADPAAPPAEWRIYAQDLADVLDRVATRPLVLAGHSMGAAVAIEAATLRPHLVRQLVAIDPALVPLDATAAWRATDEPPNPMAAQAARRRPAFPSRHTARQAYRGRGAFADWPDAALDAYLEDGLIDDGSSVSLACAPEWEAATFRSVTTRLAELVSTLPRPVAFLAARKGGTLSAGDAGTLAAAHPGSSAALLEGSHFVPIARPDLVRPALQQALSRAPALSGREG